MGYFEILALFVASLVFFSGVKRRGDAKREAKRQGK